MTTPSSSPSPRSFWRKINDILGFQEHTRNGNLVGYKHSSLLPKNVVLSPSGYYFIVIIILCLLAVLFIVVMVGLLRCFSSPPSQQTDNPVFQEVLDDILQIERRQRQERCSDTLLRRIVRLTLEQLGTRDDNPQRILNDPQLFENIVTRVRSASKNQDIRTQSGGGRPPPPPPTIPKQQPKKPMVGYFTI
ncbi:hypothetical protein EBS02_08910 [bacterium]|nr:hypothetical protein [bacterium]